MADDVITTLVRLRVTIWQRTPNAMRWLGITIGTALALWTLAIAAGAGGAAEPTKLLLALLYIAWMAGWVLGPIQTGSSDFLRPEWFAMLTIRPRRLTVGLLIAGCASVGAAVTLVASAGLVVYGASLSVGAAVVGAVAAALQLLLMIAVSKLVAETLGSSSKSRLMLEVTAAQYGLFVALMFVGWFVIWQLVQIAGEVGAGLGDLVPAAETVILALPPAWGVVAVDAAGGGDWLVAAAALAGLALLTFLVVLRWSRLLQRRTAQPAAGGYSRPRDTGGRQMLPSSPLGAVIRKDLRTWWRDPRRGFELRSALWAALFMTALLWVLEPASAVFAGVIVVFIGAMGSVNVYAMDGTALWYTLLTPDAERTDVRGRQLAWLLIFAPISVVLSVIGLAITQAMWAVPWILALVPALLGAGAGLIPLLSIVGLVPETDAHKRSGNPAETGGDATGLYFAMFFALPVLAAPTAGVLAASVVRDEPALAWLGAVVGVLTGIAYGWGFGRIAARSLKVRGPELLLKMRVGPTAQAATSDKGTEWSTAQSWLVGLLTTVSMVSIFPLGLVSLIRTLVGGEDAVQNWFVPAALPTPLRIVVAIGFVVLGLLAGWWAIKVHRRASEK